VLTPTIEKVKRLLRRGGGRNGDIFRKGIKKEGSSLKRFGGWPLCLVCDVVCHNWGGTNGCTQGEKNGNGQIQCLLDQKTDYERGTNLPMSAAGEGNLPRALKPLWIDEGRNWEKKKDGTFFL